MSITFAQKQFKLLITVRLLVTKYKFNLSLTVFVLAVQEITGMPIDVGRLAIRFPINDMIARQKFRERNVFVAQVKIDCTSIYFFKACLLLIRKQWINAVFE